MKMLFQTKHNSLVASRKPGTLMPFRVLFPALGKAKTFLASLLPAFILLLSACADDFGRDFEDAADNKVIGFKVGECAESRAVKTDINTLKEKGFGVFAYSTGTANYAGNSKPNFMYNQKVEWVDGGGLGGQNWTYEPIKYWPANPAEKVSFFAYAPYTATTSTVGITSFPVNNTAGQPKIGYNQPTEPSKQYDLVYASTENATNGGGEIPVRFKHALAYVNFVMKKGSELETTEVRVSKITMRACLDDEEGINSAPSSGDFNLYTNKWENLTYGDWETSFDVRDEGNSYFNLTTSPEVMHASNESDCHFTCIPRRRNNEDESNWSAVYIKVNSSLVKNGVVTNNTVESEFLIDLVQGFEYNIPIIVHKGSLEAGDEPWIEEVNDVFLLENVEQDGFGIKGHIEGRSGQTYTLTSIKDSNNQTVSKGTFTTNAGDFEVPASNIDWSKMEPGMTYAVTIKNPKGEELTEDCTMAFDYMDWNYKTPSANKTIRLPFEYEACPVDILVSWGDGTQSSPLASITSANSKHTFSAAGNYKVRILTLETNPSQKQVPNYYHPAASYGSMDIETSYIGDYRYEKENSGDANFTAKKWIWLRSITTPLLHSGQKDLSYLFDHTEYMKSVCEDLFEKCADVEDLSFCFRQRSTGRLLGGGSRKDYGLSGLTENLFKGLHNLKNISFIFGSCNFTNLPDGLFSDCNLIENAYMAFYECLISEIPAKLFSDKEKLKNVSWCFYSCWNVEKIGRELFAGCNKLEDARSCFCQCFKLKEIGDEMFSGCTNLNNINSLFSIDRVVVGGVDITPTWTMEPLEIVSEVDQLLPGRSFFNGCTSLVENCSDMFYGPSNEYGRVLRIPSDFLDGLVNLKDATKMFWCSGLQSIPEHLFDSCTEITNFSYAFASCTKLNDVPINIFDYCTEVTCFDLTFDGCSGITSAVPQLWAWPWTNVFTHSGCFRGCTNAANYSSIPNRWK